MQILKEIDIKQTRRNAREVLKSFRRLERIAGRSLIDIKSPIITEMPKTPRHGNKAEEALIQKMDIEAERDAILAALMALRPMNRQVLYYCYCLSDGFSDYKISREIGYSERSVQRIKSEALIEFAEAYKYGELIAYK